jgi:DNA-binding response OmpR family regulator
MPQTKADPEFQRARRILIVDDNVDLARGIARLLQIHGHDVQIAHDGPSGLARARESRPEFLLLDIGLPGIDGYQLAAQIRRDDGLKGATLIAISGYDRDDDRMLAQGAGFDHHLVKPIDCDELIKLIKDLK